LLKSNFALFFPFYAQMFHFGAAHNFHMTSDAEGKIIVCSCDSSQARIIWLAHLQQSAAEDFYTETELLGFKCTITHMGLVRKKGRLNTAFAERFFVLSEGELKYYKTQDAFETRPFSVAGAFDCRGMHVEICLDPARTMPEGPSGTVENLLHQRYLARANTGKAPTEAPQYFFTFNVADREMVCSVGSAEERQAWVEKVRAAARELNNHPKSLVHSVQGQSKGPLAMPDCDGIQSSDKIQPHPTGPAMQTNKHGPPQYIGHQGYVLKRGQVNTEFQNRYSE